MILLVIDTQRGIMDERLYAFERVRDNIGMLIQKARESGTEVVYVRHDDGAGSGFSAGDEAFEIYEGFAPADGERIFDKTVNSAFHPSVGLADYLTKKGEKQIVAVGLQTDFCMDATIKSGFEHCYDMIVPAYANSTFTNPYMTAEETYEYFNKYMWPGRYAHCVTADEAAALLGCKAL